MTLQYEPLGRPVMNVVVQSFSALLIATKPSEPLLHAREFPPYWEKRQLVPREKAICWNDGETQPVIGALPTSIRKPTMPAIAGQRCWQNLQRMRIVHMQKGYVSRTMETWRTIHPFRNYPRSVLCLTRKSEAEESSSTKKVDPTVVWRSHKDVVEVRVAREDHRLSVRVGAA